MECRLKSLVLVLLVAVNADGRNIIADVAFPSNITVVEGRFFTSTAMRALIGADRPKTFTVMKAGLAEFPALSGYGVSYAVIQHPAGTINPPHSHPHSSELMFLLAGTLVVGFIDTGSKLYTQTLQAGDMFIFPEGLVLYQYNNNREESCFALSAFGNSTVETVSAPGELFTVGISDRVLAKAFKTDILTVQNIKARLGPTV